MAILRNPEHFWPALWLCVAAVLGAVISLEHFLGSVEIGTGPRAPAKVVEAKLLPSFTLPPEAQSTSETVARPLFVPTRRLSPPVAAATLATMRKGQFVLTGVTVLPEESFVFLKEVATGKTQSVKKGAMVNGITVHTVEPRRVVLRQGEETEELPLNIQVPARVVAAPAPTGAVPPPPGAAPVPATVPAQPSAAVAPGLAPTAQGRDPVAATPPSRSAPPATPAAPEGAPQTSGRRRPWINAQ